MDEAVIMIDAEQHWLFVAVTLETNVYAEFYVDGAPLFRASLFGRDLHFRHETHGNRNPVERVVQEIKRQTDQFHNTFPDANPEMVDP